MLLARRPRRAGEERPTLVTQRVVASGAIAGWCAMRDGLPGASILALGTAPLPAMARTDSRPVCADLPAGNTSSRHAGYVSTYREPVRVQSSTTLQRNITLA
jgi:hypothetical protein